MGIGRLGAHDIRPTTSGGPTSSWWELRISVDPEQEDIAFWRLETFGCHGTASEIRGKRRFVRAYIPVEDVTILDLAALSLQLRQDALQFGFSPASTSWERLESEDWSRSWKAHWQPQEIGDRILICPEWLEVPPHGDRFVVMMDPGVAFGTGMHPTTQLCMEALEMRLDGLPPEERLTIADVGCGSGILAIAAGKLGAIKVYAVDTDPLAVAATQHNAIRNDLGDTIEVSQGSLSDIPVRVDGLVCNILAEVILDLIPQFRLVLREKGWLVLSGILLEQAKTVTETLEAHGWMVAALWKRQEWCCLNVRSS
jgi:ribosomal protein L11 methyltransferase